MSDGALTLRVWQVLETAETGPLAQAADRRSDLATGVSLQRRAAAFSVVRLVASRARSVATLAQFQAAQRRASHHPPLPASMLRD
jgi:hypothetical protein